MTASGFMSPLISARKDFIVHQGQLMGQKTSVLLEQFARSVLRILLIVLLGRFLYDTTFLSFFWLFSREKGFSNKSYLLK